MTDYRAEITFLPDKRVYANVWKGDKYFVGGILNEVLLLLAEKGDFSSLLTFKVEDQKFVEGVVLR
jgi:hypothetical protein